jgi:hypothetical protein
MRKLSPLLDDQSLTGSSETTRAAGVVKPGDYNHNASYWHKLRTSKKIRISPTCCILFYWAQYFNFFFFFLRRANLISFIYMPIFPPLELCRWWRPNSSTPPPLQATPLVWNTFNIHENSGLKSTLETTCILIIGLFHTIYNDQQWPMK